MLTVKNADSKKILKIEKTDSKKILTAENTDRKICSSVWACKVLKVKQTVQILQMLYFCKMLFPCEFWTINFYSK